MHKYEYDFLKIKIRNLENKLWMDSDKRAENRLAETTQKIWKSLYPLWVSKYIYIFVNKLS
jgi:hypothetical protein